MSKDKEQLKDLLEILKETTISLRKFLILYYGINIDLHGNKLSHSDLKCLFPNIKRVSFEYVLNNKELAFNGDIICVFDSFNNPAFYKRPDVEVFDDIEYIETIEENNCEKEFDLIFEDLNTYELSMLCKNLKNLNRLDDYRKAYKILKDKKQKKLRKERRLKEDNYD